MDEAQAYLGRGLQELKGVSESFKIYGIPQMLKTTTTPEPRSNILGFMQAKGVSWPLQGMLVIHTFCTLIRG